MNDQTSHFFRVEEKMVAIMGRGDGCRHNIESFSELTQTSIFRYSITMGTASDGRARHVCFGEGEEEGRISLEQNVKKQLIFKGPTTDLKEILRGKEVTWAKAITVYFYLGSNSRVH